MNKIKIAQLNAHSITNKIFEINEYLSTNKIDILCINETFLHSQNKHINLLKNYKIIRCDRIGRLGGGVAIILNNNIRFKLLKQKSSKNIEYIALELFNNNEKIILINAYAQPKSKTKFGFLNQFKKCQTTN